MASPVPLYAWYKPAEKPASSKPSKLFQTRLCERYGECHVEHVPLNCSFSSLMRPPCGTAGGKQSKIFESSWTATRLKTSFLSLPFPVRRRIYLEAGVPHRYYCDLDFEFHVDSVAASTFSRKSNLPSTLLRVSRTVHEDVQTILYSENTFVSSIDRGLHTSMNLQPLRNLSPRAISLLTHLRLTANFITCDHKGGCRHTHGKEQKPPLVLDCCSRGNIELYREWQYTIRYLAMHFTPARLRLDIDLEGLRSPEAIRLCLEPFLQVPELVACPIKLPSRSSSEAVDLARVTIARVTRSESAASAFPRFLELPLELQTYILEYTGLVTPFREVECQPHKYHGLDLKYRIRSGLRDFGDEVHSEGCDQCMHHVCRWRPPDCADYYFCRRYGVQNPQCRCWFPPTDLFLVSRGIKETAQKIFFSSNRFIVLPRRDTNYRQHICFERLHMTSFLRRVKRLGALRCLRRVEFALPVFQKDHYLFAPFAFSDWADTVEETRMLLDLPNLSITLYVAAIGLAMQPRGVIDRQRLDFMTERYHWFLRPLSQLAGLKDFFVYVKTETPFATLRRMPRPWGLEPVYLWASSQGVEQYDATRDPSAQALDDTLDQSQLVERDIERFVMGPSYVSDTAKTKHYVKPQYQVQFEHKAWSFDE